MTTDRIVPSAKAMEAIAEIEARMREKYRAETAELSERAKSQPPVVGGSELDEPAPPAGPVSISIRDTNRGILDASRTKVVRPTIKDAEGSIVANSNEAFVKGPDPEKLLTWERERAKENAALAEAQHEERLKRQRLESTSLLEEIDALQNDARAKQRTIARLERKVDLLLEKLDGGKADEKA